MGILDRFTNRKKADSPEERDGKGMTRRDVLRGAAVAGAALTAGALPTESRAGDASEWLEERQRQMQIFESLRGRFNLLYKLAYPRLEADRRNLPQSDPRHMSAGFPAEEMEKQLGVIPLPGELKPAELGTYVDALQGAAEMLNTFMSVAMKTEEQGDIADVTELLVSIANESRDLRAKLKDIQTE